jgi:hypothetical protein
MINSENVANDYETVGHQLSESGPIHLDLEKIRRSSRID